MIEIFAKIFVVSLILVMGAVGVYCSLEIDRIKDKWSKEGKNEWQVKADFYRNFDD